ncbi:MAG: uL15 family ribosomal protein [Candidatus Methanomethylophilaceae archaeon]|nr:uL15 family ribosomal protein [Candidatus Methanomethylophilaceae archaeon]
MPSRTRKLRGSRTHGRGKKAGRGAGLTGGRGMAGFSKSKKILMLKTDRNYFGRHGFKRPQSVVDAAESKETVNVSDLEERMGEYVEKKYATKKGDAYSLDLSAAGISKLLGAGNINLKVNVTVEEASAKAREKIEAAGGSVIGIESSEEE